MCNALEINIELISIRADDKKSDDEHYPQSPYIYNMMKKYNLGLAKSHYFINEHTELTSYCLDHYEEVKEIKD